jgi:hypothetical protein
MKGGAHVKGYSILREVPEPRLSALAVDQRVAVTIWDISTGKRSVALFIT